MPDSFQVMQEFNNCVDSLIEKINLERAKDQSEEVLVEKMQRIIHMWFKNYGKFKKVY